MTEQENVDVFGEVVSPVMKSGDEKGRVLSLRDEDGGSEGDQDVWVDTDVEAEVELEGQHVD